MQSGIKANACLETRTDWHALRATPRWCPINSWHHLNFWKKNPQQNVQRVRRSAERTPYPEYTAYTYGKTLLGHSESNQALTLLLLFFLLKNIESFDCERVQGVSYMRSPNLHHRGTDFQPGGSIRSAFKAARMGL